MAPDGIVLPQRVDQRLRSGNLQKTAMRSSRRALLALVAAASLSACSAYYLPGTYPQEFTKGQKLRGETSCDAMIAPQGGEQAVLVWPPDDPLVPNASDARRYTRSGRELAHQPRN